MNNLKFNSPKDMLNAIQSGIDLYNPISNQYIFCYNIEGSICMYYIDNAKANELMQLSEEFGEYWGAYLGSGGYIYDDPSHNLYSKDRWNNLEYCESVYDLDGWIDVTPKTNRKGRKIIMGLPIYNYLDLSTAHIKKQTDRFLDRESQWPLTDIIVYKKWGGYFVFVPNHDDLGDSLESDQIPMDLKRCIKFARKHGCNWILFDSDAEIVSELPTYRW